MVAKFLDLNSLSGQIQSFALSNDERKVIAAVLFLSAITHRKVIHVNYLSLFLPYLEYHDLLKSANFATMAT